MSEFDEYLVHGEPGQREKADVWQTAIGLQDVDGLKVSAHLLDTARQHIEGDITIDEARKLIAQYYQTKTGHDFTDEEGDKASANIAKILSEPSFAFSFVGLTSIHRQIFEGIFKFAGKIRDVEISKKEWVLGGNASVSYHPVFALKDAIEYDLQQEKQFSYVNLSMAAVIAHIARFIADLWQIHPFREGNTRTTAVFLIKYLRSMGLTVSNEMFKTHSWFFRNSLVRASYKDLKTEPTTEFLELFLRNVLLNEQNELRNRMMRTDFQSATSVALKCKICTLDCTLEEMAVLNCIQANPKITQASIAKEIGKSQRTIKTITASLVDKGIIARQDGRRNGWWKIQNTDN